MKKWQFSKPKIVDWYLDFSKESYTTLKSVISSFKICFQNYGQLKRKFLRPKNTSSTFLKFELSSLSGAMLKTRKNTIRNRFGQQWFNLISFQKPRRVYPAIWYNLKPFANMKGRFKLSTPAKSRKVAKGQRTIIKITTFLRPGIGFYRTEQCLWVYVSYLSIGFLDIGIKKENLWLLSKGIRRLRYFLRIDHLPPVLGLVFRGNTYDWHGARHGYFVIKFWTLLHETFTWIYRKYADTNNNSSICRVFVVFSRKRSGKQIHAKTIWLKKCFKAYPGYEATSISSK